jgi:hypothetical protein
MSTEIRATVEPGSPGEYEVYAATFGHGAFGNDWEWAAHFKTYSDKARAHATAKQINKKIENWVKEGRNERGIKIMLTRMAQMWEATHPEEVEA